MRKKVLVTGAGGYIGSVLVPKLLQRGYEVIAVDRFFFGKDKLKQTDGLYIVQEDVRFMKPDLLKGVDFVVDLVAISNDPTGERFNEATWQINYQARVRTAKLSKNMGVKRYILPSSCSIYGFQEEMVDEESPTNPLTTYAKANEKAEKDILPLADKDFVVVVLRQATVFGYSPRMRFD
ncbi:MAG: SDR family oxidoreductase, partial [candidate division WOR-3 bacterium]|nr:SDR family oxidoreductase [candidate division WOR-3 bacterium]